MTQCMATKNAWVDNRYVKAGDIVDIRNPSGSVFQPLDAAARERFARRSAARQPATTYEIEAINLRLDALEAAIGLEAIKAATAKREADEAAAREKAAADKRASEDAAREARVAAKAAEAEAAKAAETPAPAEPVAVV